MGLLVQARYQTDFCVNLVVVSVGKRMEPSPEHGVISKARASTLAQLS